MTHTILSFKTFGYVLLWAAVVGGLFVLSFWVLPAYTTVSYTDVAAAVGGSRADDTGNNDASAAGTGTNATDTVSHVETPDKVRAVYMTSWVAGTPRLRQPIVEMIKDTELNSIVVDIKDDTGRISFSVDDPFLKQVGSSDPRIKDLRGWIAKLHEHDIYVIGRIASFQDPCITQVWPSESVKVRKGGAIWKNRKGQTWIDPGSKKAWKYLTAIGDASYAAGFDELQYDYIRYPTDGDTSRIYYPVSHGRNKAVVIETFFRHLHEHFKDRDVVLSADLFGMTATAENDMDIGQQLERALPYFDYISPMVYPSHYPDHSLGYTDPASHPYGIVYKAMERATQRAVATTTRIQHLDATRIGTSTPAIYTKESYDPEKIRPWLQDFSLRVQYSPQMVRDQIRATYDAGLDSWMLWDARNTYSRDAFKAANPASVADDATTTDTGI